MDVPSNTAELPTRTVCPEDTEDAAGHTDEQTTALAAALRAAGIAERAAARQAVAASSDATDAGMSTATSPSAEEERQVQRDLARHARIAVVAYLLAEQRGFAPGRDIEDWLLAEREVDATDAEQAAPDAG